MTGIVGYTGGVFDLFHVGHLNLLRRARSQCDFLIAGVSTDPLAEEVKGKLPIIPFIERMSIVQSVRYVDHVVPQLTMDKLSAWATLKFDVLFAGENVRGTEMWNMLEKSLAEVSAHVVYVNATYMSSGQLLAHTPEDEPGAGA